MAKTHLRPQTGGDPSQGRADDLKNQSPAPAADNDFPDAPDQTNDESPQDKPDLDAFARRMGTDTIETGDAADAVPEQRSTTPEPVESSTDSRLIIGGVGVAIAALLVVVLRRRKRHTLLSRAVALGAAANVIRH